MEGDRFYKIEQGEHQVSARGQRFHRMQRQQRRKHQERNITNRDGIELRFWPCPHGKIAENTGSYSRSTRVDAPHVEFVSKGLKAD
jgi:hypothetical protein